MLKPGAPKQQYIFRQIGLLVTLILGTVLKIREQLSMCLLTKVPR